MEKFRPGLEVSLQKIYISERWEFYIKDGSFKYRTTSSRLHFFRSKKISPGMGVFRQIYIFQINDKFDNFFFFYQPSRLVLTLFLLVFSDVKNLRPGMEVFRQIKIF